MADISMERAIKVIWIAAVLLLAGFLTFLTTAAAPIGGTTAAVAGDFQSELGCDPALGPGGDWAPSCPETELVEQPNFVFRNAFTLPAGEWSYKVALNDSWDQSFPAGDVALLLPASTDVRFYYDAKTNAVLDSVNDVIAVAAGSFQGELGCPDDWQPWCVGTLLTDVDNDGVYSLETDALGAGDYEFKVALDEGWATSYPSDNATFTVPAGGAAVTISYDSATNEVSVTISGAQMTDPSLTAPPAHSPIEQEKFYFVVTDRFDDGNPANNEGNVVDGTLAETGYDPTDISFYHGGDFAGLADRLDYIDSLGISAIWITPPYVNQPTQPDSSAGPGFGAAYHGYWILDYENADAHLGSNADLQTFIDMAHARGIKVYFDFVVNHTADVIEYGEETSSYIDKDSVPYQDASGTPFDDRDFAGGETFPALDAATSFPYTPEVEPAMADVKNPAWLNNPIYYHNRGDSTFSGESSLYGDFFGLDDLFTEHPDVVDGYIDIAKYLIDSYNIDGMRLDTVKHVNIEFWQAFAPEVMAYANARGIGHFSMFGEVFDGNPAFMSRYTTEGGLPSVVDFGLLGAARNFAVSSGDGSNLRDFFEKDDYYTDVDSSAYSLGNFVSNHDGGIERVGHQLQNQHPSAADATLVDRSELAHALIYFARGFPIVYYGDEQGFSGGGSDKLAREDMMASQTAAYNDNDLIGTSDSTADANFDQTHPLYQALQEMGAVRDQHGALQQGAQLLRYAEESAGIFAFSRIDRDEQIEYLILLNNSSSGDVASVQTETPNGSFEMVYSSNGATRGGVVSDGDGNVTVSVPAFSAVIYKAESTIGCDGVAPGLAISVPAELVGRVEIGATLDDNVYTEVTFAVSSDGGANYTIIGTDDNAPYRVFYPVEEYEVGSELLFQAVANDVCSVDNANSVDAASGMVIGEDMSPEDGKPRIAIVHYNRGDDDYGDGSSNNYNDFWGLHLWGDPFDVQQNRPMDAELSWINPMRFWGEDDFGRFAWIYLDSSADESAEIGFIIHRGDTKDGTDADRFFQPFVNSEIWINGGDPNIYFSEAAARGEVTIHYQRPDGEYGDADSSDYNDFWGLHLWQPGSWGTAWTSPLPPSGVDDYGAYYDINEAALEALIGEDIALDLNLPIYFIVHKGDVKDPADGPDRFYEFGGAVSHIWLQSDDEQIYEQRAHAENVMLIHYRRPEGDYGDYSSSDFNDFWGLHVWGDHSSTVSWTDPLRPVMTDTFGVVFEVPLTEFPAEIGYIIHRGDDKDPGASEGFSGDQFLNFATWGYEVWQMSMADPSLPYVYPVEAGGAAGPNLNKRRAHWVNANTIVWPDAEDTGLDYSLHYNLDGGLEFADGGSNGMSVPLTPAGTYDALDNNGWFPHLDGMPMLTIDESRADVETIIKSQTAVIGVEADQVIIGTGIQIPGVLDDLYYYEGELGVSWEDDVPTLRLWAPTAQSVQLHLFDDADMATTSTVHEMVWDGSNAVWSVTGSSDWNRKFYLFEVTVFVPATGNVENNLVTDPYSLSLSTNSKRSQIVDLDSDDLKPQGWESVTKPEFGSPENISVYELHVRDFSIFDETVPEAWRGTYMAFTAEESHGMQHLQRLADAGLTHLHLLPVFDIATVEEARAEQETPDYELLASYPPTSTMQQAILEPLRDEDGFNWGYDPYHYTAPEGSYSTDPDGVRRIIEFREMVKALNEADLRVVMDVVYNHTSEAGQGEKSVLDKVVPGYYHRLDLDGNIETSTCCQNTASEHLMMEKLMVDSLLTWATDYKVDAFRFDLMGHHMKRNMLKVQEALAALTVNDDGVDGSDIYLYGEGWNFGEVANNARGENATQLNMAGTGIGTFSDRLRDAVRGPGPFDSGADLARQGFINGQFYDPNDHPGANDLGRLLLLADQVRVGLAGNLRDFTFEDRNGNVVSGAEVDYNGSPTGYTEDPQEVVTYVSKHDNQTLFDINAYTLPADTPSAERVRVQNLGLSIVTFGQGVHFFHAGSDILRSKSLDRDSYNSGDWFNRLDWTYEDNNFGVGLPPQGSNGDNWPFMIPVLANEMIDPSMAEILFNHQVYQEYLQIRTSSPLFSLETAAEVEARLAYHNTGPAQLPGLIVMSLSDMDGRADIDPVYDLFVVLINANDAAQTIAVDDLAGLELTLHPVQQQSVDERVQQASFDMNSGTFDVPARTTAVFALIEAQPSITLALRVGQNGICGADAVSVVAAVGDSVNFCYTVENDGEVTLDEHTLIDSTFGTLIDGMTLALAPGASYSVMLTQTITQSALHEATWLASGAGLAASATATVQVTVGAPTSVDGAQVNPGVLAQDGHGVLLLTSGGLLLGMAALVALRRRRQR